MQIEAAVYTSGAEMMAAYADRRRRLMGGNPPRTRPPVLVLVHVPPKPRPAETVNWRGPLWLLEEITFNAHVEAWQIHQSHLASPIGYVKRRCKQMGHSYEDMIGPRRTRDIVHDRQTLMWEVKQKFPLVSLPFLGRMFGGRDHTTAIHSLRKIDAEKAIERANG